MKVRTVLGDIPKEELGFTYSHEHLWCCPPPQQKDRDFELTNFEASLKELNIFGEIGGRTLVDASTIDYGRDGGKLKEMALLSNVHVLGVTGFNKYIYYPDWVAEKTTREISEMMIRDIEKGMDGTDAKAGIIKVGSWYNMIHPLEEKTTIAAAWAHRETGTPIWAHTECGTMGLEMIEILTKEGVDAEAIAIGHLDRNTDPYYHLKLAEKGVYIQFDGPSKVKYAPDSVRMELIHNLLKNGYGNKLLISGDMGRQSYLHSYGGGPGFRYIKEKFIPRMLDQGVTESEIHQIFYDNPANWLAKF